MARSSAGTPAVPASRLAAVALMALTAALLALIATGCTPKPAATTPEPAAQSEQPPATPEATPTPQVTELKIEDSKVGSGAEAKPGDEVTVHYTGYLTDGTKFDSSLDRNKPFRFKVGNGDVIAGWDKGIPGMKVGGKRKLTIPSDMGYGSQGAGGVIPPNATLVFDVELIAVD